MPRKSFFFFSTFSALVPAPVCPSPLPLSFSVLVVEFETLLRRKKGEGDCTGVRSSSRHMPRRGRGMKGTGKGNGFGYGSGWDSSYSSGSGSGNTFEEGHIAGAAAVEWQSGG